MKRFVCVILPLFLLGPAFSAILPCTHPPKLTTIPDVTDSSKNKTKPVTPLPVKPPRAFTKSFKSLLKAPADTLNTRIINAAYDTSMVMAMDFPMPVDENSYFENDLYKKRLDSLSRRIILPYNESVQSYINLYVYKRRPLIERLLGEGEYYFPIFEKALQQAGIPQELKYLPIIESALNPFAVSRAGATGPWQFMPGTGRDYGLAINSSLDERRDPYRSSQAAAHYLKDMYGRYGDWLLVIASYNCGKGNVDKAIRRSGGLKDFWSIQRYLPRETRTYVPAFIAAAYTMNYARHHGMHSLPATFSIRPDSLKVSQTVSLSAVSDGLCLTPEELRRLNPQFKKGMATGTDDAPVTILVPEGHQEQFPGLLAQMQQDPAPFSQKSHDIFSQDHTRSFFSRLIHHRVRSGETLKSIASRYACDVHDLKAWNRLRSSNLRPGQHLKIKQMISSSSDGPDRSARSARYLARHSHSRRNGKQARMAFGHSGRYRVQHGDTLEAIANRFNISVGRLKGINRLHSNRVNAGQNLSIGSRI